MEDIDDERDGLSSPATPPQLVLNKGTQKAHWRTVHSNSFDSLPLNGSTINFPITVHIRARCNRDYSLIGHTHTLLFHFLDNDISSASRRETTLLRQLLYFRLIALQLLYSIISLGK